jgi:hypothetical protein
MRNPRSAAEVVVDENVANQAPPVGGTFTYHFYAHNQPDLSGAPPAPTVTMRVVGVVKELPQFVFVSQGQILVSGSTGQPTMPIGWRGGRSSKTHSSCGGKAEMTWPICTGVTCWGSGGRGLRVSPAMPSPRVTT